MPIRCLRDTWRLGYTTLLHANSCKPTFLIPSRYTHISTMHYDWKKIFPCRNQSCVKCVTTDVTYLTIILVRQGRVDRKRWNQYLQILTQGRHPAVSEGCSWSVLLVQAVPSTTPPTHIAELALKMKNISSKSVQGQCSSWVWPMYNHACLYPPFKNKFSQVNTWILGAFPP
jgi:hypothetical protein